MDPEQQKPVEQHSEAANDQAQDKNIPGQVSQAAENDEENKNIQQEDIKQDGDQRVEEQQQKQNEEKHQDDSQQKHGHENNVQKEQAIGEQVQNQMVEKDVEETQQIDAIKVEGILQRPVSVSFGKDALYMEDNQITLEQSTIVITVPSSEDRGFALNKHTYYKIVGKDNHGSFEIERRLSEFESLRKTLLERWPGCFIPYLSQRSDIKSEELRSYHKKRNLQQFLIKIAVSEFIYYKEEVQLFLRSIGMDMNEMFQTMPILRVKDVAERFKVSFGDDVERPSRPENATYITHFSTSLKKVINSLGDLSKKALKLADSYDLYRNVMPTFSKIVTNYQQNILSEYTSGNPDKLIAMRDSDSKLEKFNILAKQNIFYEFYFLFETESRDAEALGDIILAMEMFNIKKDQLETKSKEARLEIDQICLGHKNLKVMTSRKPKEEVISELEQKQKEYIAEKHSITELYNISEIVLASKTIKNFKKMKKNNYLKIIKLWAQATGAITDQLHALWKFLEEEAKIQAKKADQN